MPNTTNTVAERIETSVLNKSIVADDCKQQQQVCQCETCSNYITLVSELVMEYYTLPLQRSNIIYQIKQLINNKHYSATIISSLQALLTSLTTLQPQAGLFTSFIPTIPVGLTDETSTTLNHLVTLLTSAVSNINVNVVSPQLHTATAAVTSTFSSISNKSKDVLQALADKCEPITCILLVISVIYMIKQKDTSSAFVTAAGVIAGLAALVYLDKSNPLVAIAISWLIPTPQAGLDEVASIIINGISLAMFSIQLDTSNLRRFGASVTDINKNSKSMSEYLLRIQEWIVTIVDAIARYYGSDLRLRFNEHSAALALIQKKLITLDALMDEDKSCSPYMIEVINSNMLELDKILTKLAPIPQNNAIRVVVKELYSKAAKHYAYARRYDMSKESRQEPMIIAIVSQPGTGKTTLIKELSDDLLIKGMNEEQLQDYKDGGRPSSIYYRPTNPKFYDGYQGQHTMVMNEAFSLKDVPGGVGETDASCILNAIGTNPYQLPMSRVEEKGIYFTSKLMIIASNLLVIKPNLFSSMQDINAITRRVKGRTFYLGVNPKYGHNPSNFKSDVPGHHNDPFYTHRINPATAFDLTKSSDVYRFVEWNWEAGVPMSNVQYNYDEFLALITERRDRHCDKAAELRDAQLRSVEEKIANREAALRALRPQANSEDTSDDLAYVSYKEFIDEASWDMSVDGFIPYVKLQLATRLDYSPEIIRELSIDYNKCTRPVSARLQDRLSTTSAVMLKYIIDNADCAKSLKKFIRRSTTPLTPYYFARWDNRCLSHTISCMMLWSAEDWLSSIPWLQMNTTTLMYTSTLIRNVLLGTVLGFTCYWAAKYTHNTVKAMLKPEVSSQPSYIPQIITADSSPENFMRRISMDNTFVLSVRREYKDTETRIRIMNYCLAIGGKCLVTVSHCKEEMDNWYADPKISNVFLDFNRRGSDMSSTPDFSYAYQDCTFNMSLQDTDIMTITLPNVFPDQRDIRKFMFQSKADPAYSRLSNRNKNYTSNIAYDSNVDAHFNVPYLINTTATPAFNISYPTAISAIDTYTNTTTKLVSRSINLPDAIIYPIPTKGGECGTISFWTDTAKGLYNKQIPVIASLHVAGTGTTGVGIILRADMFKSLTPNKGYKAPLELMQEKHKLYYEKLPSLNPVKVTFDEDDEHTLNPGQCKVAFRDVAKPYNNSKIEKSIIFKHLVDAIGKPDRYPASLNPHLNQDGIVVNPIDIATKGYGTNNSCNVPSVPLSIVAAVVTRHIIKMSTPIEYKPTLSIEECIVGVDGANPINRNKSPGPTIYTVTGVSDRKDLFGNGDVPSLSSTSAQEFLLMVKDMDTDIRAKIIAPNLFATKLKSSCVSATNNLKGKIRAFHSGDLDVLLLTKKYFGQMLDWLKSNHTKNKMAVGMNPYSKDWDNLYYTMIAKGNSNIVALDYKQYDKTCSSQVIAQFKALYTMYYKDAPEQDCNARDTLFEDFLNSYHCVNIEGKMIYYNVLGSVSSGSGLTTYVNCFVNLLQLTCAVMKSRVSDVFASDYKASVAELAIDVITNTPMCVYGDDCLIRPPIGVNFCSIRDNILTLFNMPTTNESVSDEDDTMEDVSFIARRFSRVEIDGVGKVLAPLRFESIMSPMYWDQKHVDNEVFLAQVDTVFKELALHGIDTFTQYTQPISASLLEECNMVSMFSDYSVAIEAVCKSEFTDYSS